MLEGNFLNEQKELKAKERQLYEIQLKAGDTLRMATSILQEVDEVARRC